jgi:hypothetical protein
MNKSSALLWLTVALILASGDAQETVTSFVSSETATPQANTFTVAVGRVRSQVLRIASKYVLTGLQGGHTFSPDVVQAAVGDIIGSPARICSRPRR